MSSVTKRIKEIKQPWGGYLKPSQFNAKVIQSEDALNEEENIPPYIIGMAVDYLTRFMMGKDVIEAFKISCMGALAAERLHRQKGTSKIARELLTNITDIDDNSITNACKMVTFDVWYRNHRNAPLEKSADEINPNENTIYNIRTMVNRSIYFWDKYGPIIKDGFDFNPNGYTETVHAGDGDYLTDDTIWDFKVSKTSPKNTDTLQLLMYWIMGQHSGQKIYKNINKLGIFNPRLNTVYTIDIKEIPQETIQEIEQEVICY